MGFAVAAVEFQLVPLLSSPSMCICHCTSVRSHQPQLEPISTVVHCSLLSCLPALTPPCLGPGFAAVAAYSMHPPLNPLPCLLPLLPGSSACLDSAAALPSVCTLASTSPHPSACSTSHSPSTPSSGSTLARYSPGWLTDHAQEVPQLALTAFLSRRSLSRQKSESTSPG